MKRFVRKLRSRGGASLVFALLIFLMCVLAGTVALTAASANVGRYTHLEAEQRDYLSMASALELIQKQMDDPTHASSVTVTYVKTEKWYYKPGETTLTNEVSYTLALANPGSITSDCTDYEKLLLLNSVPQEWYDNTKTVTGSLQKDDVTVAIPTFPTTEAYRIHLDPGAGTPDPAWEDSLRDVVVVITKDDSYDLQMQLQVKHGDGADATYSYPIKVTWPGEVTTSTETTVETTGDIDPTVGSVDNAVGTRTTTTKLTCTLVWSAEDRAITVE